MTTPINTGCTPCLEGVTGCNEGVTCLRAQRSFSRFAPSSSILCYGQTRCPSRSAQFLPPISVLNSLENLTLCYVQSTSAAPPFLQILSRIHQCFSLRPFSDMPCHQNPLVAKYRGRTSEAGGKLSETYDLALCTRTCYTLVTPVTPSKIGCTPSVYRRCHTVTPYFSEIPI